MAFKSSLVCEWLADKLGDVPENSSSSSSSASPSVGRWWGRRDSRRTGRRGRSIRQSLAWWMCGTYRVAVRRIVPTNEVDDAT